MVLDLARSEAAWKDCKGTWEDWGPRELLVHLAAWMDYAVQRLRHGDDYKQAFATIQEYNRNAYEAGRHLSSDQAQALFRKRSGELCVSLSAYTDEAFAQPLRVQFKTNFRHELWRYALIDGFVHPLQHLVYQLLKTKDFEALSTVLDQTSRVVEAYEAEDLKVFDFDEFGDISDRLAESVRELRSVFGSTPALMRLADALERGSG